MHLHTYMNQITVICCISQFQQMHLTNIVVLILQRILNVHSASKTIILSKPNTLDKENIYFKRLHISEDTHWCQGYIYQRTLTSVSATYIRGHSLVSVLHTSEDTHWCQGYIHQRTLTGVRATYIRGHSLVSGLHTSEDTH